METKVVEESTEESLVNFANDQEKLQEEINVPLEIDESPPLSTPQKTVPVKKTSDVSATVKRPRHNPSERRILLAKAVEDVKNQRISMRRAAQRYNLAKSSLCDYVRKQGIILPTVRYKNSKNNTLNNPKNSCDSSASNFDKLPTQVPVSNFNNFNPSLLNNHIGVINSLKLPDNLVTSEDGHLMSPFSNGLNPVFGNLFLSNQFPQGTVQMASNNNLISKMLINMLNSQTNGHNNNNITPQNNLMQAPLINKSLPSDINSIFLSLQKLKSNNSLPNLFPDYQGEHSKQEASAPKTDDYDSSSNRNDSETESLSANAARSKQDCDQNSSCSSPKSLIIETQSELFKETQKIATNNVNSPMFANSLIGSLNSFTSSHTNGLESTHATISSLLNNTAQASMNQNGNQSLSDISDLNYPMDGLFCGTKGQFNGVQMNNTTSFQNQSAAAAATALHKAILHHPYAYLHNSLKNNPVLDTFQLNSDHTSHLFEQTNSLLSKYPTSAPSSSNNLDKVIFPKNMSSQLCAQAMLKAKELVNFVNISPTPFHVVKNVKDRLLSTGFRELKETDPNWNLKANDKVFLTKNGSTIFAIAIGGQHKPDSGFTIFGAHTDSPCLRVKPNSTRISKESVQLGVEIYGGGLWYTWFDRDLTLAGRCIVNATDSNGTKVLLQKLVNLERPVACVPSLAIHLNREQNKSFSPNCETHLAPIICSVIGDQLNSKSSTQFKDRHPIQLVESIASKIGCSPDDIVDTELYLVDTSPATIGGICNEYIHAPRLDNQFNCFVGTEGFMDSLNTLNEDENVRILCLYDHEEVGSTSCQGANSAFTANLMRRIHANLNNNVSDFNSFGAAMGKSLLVSADQAHAVHPSHCEKHERNHQPTLQTMGVVIKNNVNQRYSSNSLTTSIIRKLAEMKNVELVNFVVNQDSVCGSTIGPMLSSQLGVAAVDTGSAQLAMHSIRELCGVASVLPAINLYQSFFANLNSVMRSVQSDM